MHPLTTYKTHLKKQRNLAALHTGKSHLHSQEDACSCASSKLSYCHTGSQRFHLGCTLRSGFNTQRRSASTELYFRPTCKRDFVGYFCFYAWNKPNQWRTIANLKLLQTIKPIAFSVEWAARIPPQENGGEQLLQNYTYRYLLGASNNKRTRSWEENNCNYFFAVNSVDTKPPQAQQKLKRKTLHSNPIDLNSGSFIGSIHFDQIQWTQEDTVPAGGAMGGVVLNSKHFLKMLLLWRHTLACPGCLWELFSILHNSSKITLWSHWECIHPVAQLFHIWLSYQTVAFLSLSIISDCVVAGDTANT